MLRRIFLNQTTRSLPDLRDEINAIVTPPRAIAASKPKSRAWVSALQGVLGYLPKPKFKTQTGLDIYDAVLAGASLASWVSPGIKLGQAAFRAGGVGAAARGISAPLNQRIAASQAAGTARVQAARMRGWNGQGVIPGGYVPPAVAADVPLRMRGGGVRYVPAAVDSGAGVGFGASAPRLEQPLGYGHSTNVIGWEEGVVTDAEGLQSWGWIPIFE